MVAFLQYNFKIVMKLELVQVCPIFILISTSFLSGLCMSYIPLALLVSARYNGKTGELNGNLCSVHIRLFQFKLLVKYQMTALGFDLTRLVLTKHIGEKNHCWCH